MYNTFSKLHQEKLLLLLICLPFSKEESNKITANILKKLDFTSSLIKIENEVAIQLLWGVRTLSQCRKHQPKKGAILDLVGVMLVYVQDKILFYLKTIITVTGGFLNSPTAREKSKSLFSFTLVVKIFGFGGVVPPALIFNQVREYIMTNTIKPKSIKAKSNQQNDCKKAVILMKSKSLQEDVQLKEKMLELAAKHDLSVISVIPVPHEYDAEALERLITVIKAAKEQVTVITDNCEYIHRYNILGCAVLGTMVRFKHVQLVAYAHDISGKLFLYFPNISNIKFFHIAEMNIWKLANGDDIQVANKQLIQKQNGGN